MIALLRPIELEGETLFTTLLALPSSLAKAVWLPETNGASYNLQVWPHNEVTAGLLPRWPVLGSHLPLGCTGRCTDMPAEPQPGAVSPCTPSSFNRHQQNRIPSARDNRAAARPQQSFPARTHLLSSIQQSSLQGSDSVSSQPTAEPHVHFAT